MRLPRDVSGAVLIKALRRLGYETTRQRGSHVRVTTQRDGEHHITIPMHAALRAGLLSDILKAVAQHHRRSIEALMELLEL